MASPDAGRRAAVVYTSYFGDLGGGELRLLDHLRLTRLPRERFTLVQFAAGPLADRARQLGVESVVLPWSLDRPRPIKALETSIAATKLAALLRRRRPRLVVCNTYHDLLLAGPVAWALGIPVVWRARGEAFPFLASRRAWRVTMLLGFLRRAVARILTTTSYDRTLMLERGLAPEQVHVVRNGVDARAYALAASRAALIREELGVAPTAPLVGFVGRMVPQKGHLTFLDALASVRRRLPDVRAVIVGDTTLNDDDPEGLRARIASRTRELGLDGTVVFTGFRDDIAAIMSAIDVFAHASLKEPFGTVLIEAMACGKPVVASRTLGPQEIVEHGTTGFLVPPGDAEALAQALCAVLERPELGKRMGEMGRDRVVREFDLVRNIAVLDDHCVAVLESAR